jgi:hypothetical protein
LVLVLACKQLQENQAVAWILKTKEKNPPPKQESLVFLEMTVHRVGECGGDSRKPTKNQEEIQGSRKPSVLVGFLRQKKRTVHTLSVLTGSVAGSISHWIGEKHRQTIHFILLYYYITIEMNFLSISSTQ